MLAASQMEPQIWVYAWFFWKFQTKLYGGMHGANSIISHVSVHPALCQIWGHLNNGRWINGLEVATNNWVDVYMIDSHIIVPQL